MLTIKLTITAEYPEELARMLAEAADNVQYITSIGLASDLALNRKILNSTITRHGTGETIGNYRIAPAELPQPIEAAAIVPN